VTKRHESKLPSWIPEYIPKELVDSTLFVFNVELQTVRSFICTDCGAKYSRKPNKCNAVDDEVNNTLCGSISFKKEYEKVKIKLLPDLNLDYDILEGLMQDLPAQYAFYAMIYSEARMRVSLEERKMKAIRGTIIESIQRRAASENVRLTVEQVKNVMEADSKVVLADQRIQFAQMQCGKLYHILEALKMKSELARSLAGFKRQEYDKS